MAMTAASDRIFTEVVTAQELFDHVVNHLVQQGDGSYRLDRYGSPICLYRGPNGTSCAYGCAVTDEEAEGLDPQDGTATFNVTSLHARGRVPDRLIGHVALLDELQTSHDRAAQSEDFVAAFREEVTKVARKHNLTMPV